MRRRRLFGRVGHRRDGGDDRQGQLDYSIIGSEPLYDARGARDTTNSTDTVLPKNAATAANYLFETERMSDGAMLAWKTIILRIAAQASCTAS